MHATTLLIKGNIMSEQPAGMSTIEFKDGSTITVPFSSIKVQPSHVWIFIDGNRHVFNRRLLNTLPEEFQGA